MSDVQIKFGGDDITAEVIFSRTTFQSLADGNVGRATVLVRDLRHTFTPAYMRAGKTLELYIDGVREWDGWALGVKRGWWFEAGSDRGADEPRQWLLTGLDRNLLFQKRIIYRQGDPTDAHGLPTYDQDTSDQDALLDITANFVDLTGDDLDLSGILDTGTPGPFEDFTLAFVSAQWGIAFDDAAKITGAVFWIGPDRVVNSVDDRVVTAPFALSDKSEAGAVRYREFEAARDATEIANDALVWGAGVSSPNPVFGRHQDSSSISAYGRWQWGDLYIGGGLDSTVERRARTYVEGSPSHRRGHADPVPVVQCVIHEPGLRVGHVVDFRAHMYGYQEDLPIRSLTMTFPTPTGVRYEIEMTTRIDTPFGVPDPWGSNLPPLPGDDGGPTGPPPTGVTKDTAFPVDVDDFNRLWYTQQPTLIDSTFTQATEETTSTDVDLPDYQPGDYLLLFAQTARGVDLAEIPDGWIVLRDDVSTVTDPDMRAIILALYIEVGFSATSITLEWDGAVLGDDPIYVASWRYVTGIVVNGGVYSSGSADPDPIVLGNSEHVLQPTLQDFIDERSVLVCYGWFPELDFTINRRTGDVVQWIIPMGIDWVFVAEIFAGNLTGTDEPDWWSAPALGDTLVDGDITWYNAGPVDEFPPEAMLWSGDTVKRPGSLVWPFDPDGSLFVSYPPIITTGSSEPTFEGVAQDDFVADGDGFWMQLADPMPAQLLAFCFVDGSVLSRDANLTNVFDDTWAFYMTVDGYFLTSVVYDTDPYGLLGDTDAITGVIALLGSRENGLGGLLTHLGIGDPAWWSGGNPYTVMPWVGTPEYGLTGSSFYILATGSQDDMEVDAAPPPALPFVFPQTVWSFRSRWKISEVGSGLTDFNYLLWYLGGNFVYLRFGDLEIADTGFGVWGAAAGPDYVAQEILPETWYIIEMTLQNGQLSGRMWADGDMPGPFLSFDDAWTDDTYDDRNGWEAILDAPQRLEIDWWRVYDPTVNAS